MAREKRQRSLWCKKAKISDATTTLQSMVSSALKVRDVARERSEPTSSDPGAPSYRLIAQHYHVRKGIAGIFTSYEPGASAVSLVNDPESKQVDIAQLQPPKTQDGKRREWAEGLLYFYIRDDYVVLIQSAAVRQVQFEEHLAWLLCPKGDHIGPSVALTDQVTTSARNAVKRSHIKSVNVGGDLLQIGKSEAPSTSIHHQMSLVGPLLGAMKAMLGGSDSGFNWEDGIDGNLKAWLHLSYDRKTNEPAQKLLDKIGLALRNIDGVETELELNNGERIKGDMLRLTTKRNILAEDGVLVADEAFSAMSGWFSDLAESGELR
jgi:hypothetical protein